MAVVGLVIAIAGVVDLGDCRDELENGDRGTIGAERNEGECETGGRARGGGEEGDTGEVGCVADPGHARKGVGGTRGAER